MVYFFIGNLAPLHNRVKNSLLSLHLSTTKTSFAPAKEQAYLIVQQRDNGVVLE